MGAFARAAGEAVGRDLGDYASLWAWSTEQPEEFWAFLWRYFDVLPSAPYTSVVEGGLPKADWFTGARLNYADQVLRHRDLPGAAVVAVADDGARTELSWPELADQVSGFAATLRRLGVRPGDRVAGYLTAGVEAIVAFLGTAAVGGVWAACGPDYGAAAARDRLAQLAPSVLVATGGYLFNGKVHDRRTEAAELAHALGDVPVIAVPRAGLDLEVGTLCWSEAVSEGRGELETEQVAADHPLWVLFSSGTTGVPKGIMHGHAGVLSVHLMTLGLHQGLEPGKRLLWYTTTNWMMWNYAVSALLVGATVVMYEGSPTYPRADRLWEVVAAERVHTFGTSPGYLQACANAGHTPGRDHDLTALRQIGITGSPLPPAMNEWVAAAVSPDVPVGSTSGGTDVVAAFLGWAPGLPVWPGRLSCAMLGISVDVWSPSGSPVVDEVGELVITKPMPSMPVSFWNDPTGSRYLAAYFGTWPDVWRHGDWATRHSSGAGFTLHGRSDSTLNRGGVRIGSADIYAIVEALPEVTEALVLGVEQEGGAYWMPMFLVLADGVELDEALVAKVRTELRTQASPRHVPDELYAVAAVPHTKTGKKLEVPLKRILQGAEPSSVLSEGAVDDPTLLAYYADLARARG
ncbi:MAG: acetoacetate--CoA ligase [Nocardioides sp.]|nr:acetoacetate--CoA ligase [Nocardioides sp.]